MMTTCSGSRTAQKALTEWVKSGNEFALLRPIHIQANTGAETRVDQNDRCCAGRGTVLRPSVHFFQRIAYRLGAGHFHPRLHVELA